jgi:hypothetical protein
MKYQSIPLNPIMIACSIIRTVLPTPLHAGQYKDGQARYPMP